jgi:hypothetical protein
MKRILKYILTGAVILSLTSCERDLINEEHYRKIIYLKSGDNNICSFTHAMNDSVTEGFVTVGSAGSMPLEKDVFVTLEQDVSLLEEYNYRNFDSETEYARLLDSSRYTLPSYTAVLKAGEPSATAFLPVEADVNRLSPDTVYMIPLRIKSAQDYEINPEKAFVLYRIDLENKYSSPGRRTYRAKISRTDASGKTSVIPTDKDLIPLAHNQLRMFPESDMNSTAPGDINSKAAVIVVNGDNTVRVRPYGSIIVEQLGDCSYDAELKVFELNYRYRLSHGQDWITIHETLTRIE